MPNASFACAIKTCFRPSHTRSATKLYNLITLCSALRLDSANRIHHDCTQIEFSALESAPSLRSDIVFDIYSQQMCSAAFDAVSLVIIASPKRVRKRIHESFEGLMRFADSARPVDGEIKFKLNFTISFQQKHERI